MDEERTALLEKLSGLSTFKCATPELPKLTDLEKARITAAAMLLQEADTNPYLGKIKHLQTFFNREQKLFKHFGEMFWYRTKILTAIIVEIVWLRIKSIF